MKNMQETAANILPGQLFFVRGSIWRHCEASVKAEDATLGTAVVIMYSPLTSPHHTDRKYSKKEYIEVTIEKMLQRTEFDFFRLQ